MDLEQQKKVREEIIHRFATNLKRIREAAKLTPEEVDEKCGFQPGTVAGAETGEIIITLGAIDRIADALECTASELLQRLQL